ncbi:hypothetical protein KKI24_05155 [bacterium]|nr:hypothetical protein [bacterium]
MNRTKAAILIVEDETIIGLGIEAKLQGLGYQVTAIVNTGRKAIEKAETDRPDLILTGVLIQTIMLCWAQRNMRMISLHFAKII